MSATPSTMKSSTAPGKRIVVTLCGLAFAEWLLFELLRTPYNPPRDMLTFLGQEKYAVIALMIGMLILGAVLVVSWAWAVRSVWTAKDTTMVVTLLVLLTGAGLLVLFHPGRPVTPIHLLLK